MDLTTLTNDDRTELFTAYVERFRLGEIGPATLRQLSEAIGVSRDDIDAARNRHVDECAKNMEGQRNGK